MKKPAETTPPAQTETTSTVWPAVNTAAAWRQLLPELAGLPLLPMGPDDTGGSPGKVPADPRTGRNLPGWTTAAFTPEEVAGACSKISGVGFRPGPDAGGLIAFDVDGPTAVALLRENDCDPLTAPTWQVRRDNNADRLKVIWRIPEDTRDHLPTGTPKLITKPPSAQGAKDGENVAYYYGAGQVVALGQHLESGGNYFWPDGHGPGDVAEIPPNWWRMAWEVSERGASKGKGKASSTPGTVKGGWRRLRHCPICGRDERPICAQSQDGRFLACYHGGTFSPPEMRPGQVMTGSDGVRWAHTGIRAHGDIGDFSHFKVDEPREEPDHTAGFPDHPDDNDHQGRGERQQQLEPFHVLGWCKDREKVWYRHRQTAQIASVKPSGQAELLKLADLSYWGDRYPRQDKDGNKIMGINWARAAADLIKAANNAGVFQLEKMRGRGVWLDAGQVVWHLGHALEVDGQPVRLTDHRSAHQYALMQSLPINTQVEPLDDAHGQKILQVLRDCAWIGASDHLHLAGFCVLSSVCGALDKRPGLQITSPFSSGKTDTIDNVIMPLQGGIGLLSSGSTEAGVRQLLGTDALPATIDESEAEEGRRREAQLRLVRFSYDGKPQFKGTPGQGALTYCLRSSLALAGINSPIDNPADGSRIAVISRRMLPADQWAAVTRQRAAVITQEIGQRLIRRTVSTLPALRANVATFKKIITAMVTTGEAGRTGDTWGALLAGAHHLISTQAISEAEAAAWLDSVGWHLSHTDADEQDRRAGAEGRQCLDHLLSHETRWVHPADREEDRPTTGSVALRELVALAKRSVKFIDKDEAEKELGRKGVRVMLEGLAVANHAPGTAVIFGKTKWAGGAHRGRLLELDGAQRSSGPIHFACSGSRRAVLVPWGTVGDLGDEEPAQAA